MSSKWSQQPTKSATVISTDIFLLIDSDVNPNESKQVTFLNLSTSLAADTRTLTNKTITSTTNTIDAAVIQTGTLVVARGGTGVALSTGTLEVVLSNNPVLVTPDLGTPSAVILTSGTSLPIIGGTTGTLTVPRGGTGVLTFTDNGVLVGNGTGDINATSVGNSGEVLTSNGAGMDPTFQGVVIPKFTDVITANMTVSEGNAFSDVIVLDTQGSQVSGFVMPKNVDSKVNFKVTVPFDLSTTALNARIRTHFITVEDNTRTTVKMLLLTKATATGEEVNTAFAGGETKDFTVSTSKLVLSTQDQAIGSSLSAGDLITGQLFRDGTAGADNANDILITKINLVIDRVPFG